MDYSLEGGLRILAVSFVLFLGFLWYTNRTMFGALIWIGVMAVFVMVVGSILWSRFRSQMKQKNQDSLLSALKQAGLEDYVDNFINRFGMEKKKSNVWSYRDYSFDLDRLKDFRNFLHDKGLGISTSSWNDTNLLLQYYIQKKEEKLTAESISVTPKKFSDLSGSDFENLLYRLYSAMGYTVQKTGKTGDQGGDLIINQDQQRILIQAKCYKDMPVGNSAIQEAVAAQKFYDCTASTVVTNSDFTKEAIELARVNKVGLIGSTQLRELLLRHLKESWN